MTPITVRVSRGVPCRDAVNHVVYSQTEARFGRTGGPARMGRPPGSSEMGRRSRPPRAGATSNLACLADTHSHRARIAPSDRA